MFMKHNLLISLRGFNRHRTSFLINLFGLTTSLAVVLFITLWVSEEIQKDRFHQDTDKVFQVYSRHSENDGLFAWKGVSGLLADEIESQIPQVSHTVASTDTHEYTLSTDNQGIRTQGRFADPDFLEVFAYPLWRGKKEALDNPSNIVITRSLAKKLFGKEDVMGEMLTWHFWGQQKTVQVAGILENPSKHSSDNFDFIMSWKFYHDEHITYKGWGNFYGRVVIKIPDGGHYTQVEEKINEIFQENLPETSVELFLVNFSDQYLYNKYENGVQAGGRIDYVYALSAIGLFILLIASINFINLSTAQASLKAKEIGLKKSFGASRSNLALQFLTESLLLSSFASILATVVVFAFLEPFNQLAQTQLTFDFGRTLVLSLLGFITLTGTLAGCYPAFYLSSLKTLNALKNQSIKLGNQTFGRRALVVIQFAISIILILSTLIVSEQMGHVLHQSLGYDRHHLVYFERAGALLKNHETFLAELSNTPGVEMASATGFSLGFQNRTAGIRWRGKQEGQNVSFWENNGDQNSLEILKLEITAGRNFSRDFNDENSIIFNEKAIEIMGMENPIGQTVEHYTGEKKIIGVIKDFTTESLHNPAEPAMFFLRPEQSPYIMVRLAPTEEFETLRRIESLYERINPDHPFDPTFLDQDYQAQYASEERLSGLSKLFSILAIIISCLGLFGLVIFNIRRKTKEIGIRKVLGCKSNILTLSLTYHFTKPVFISLLLAIPLSYYINSNWLEGFASRISLSPWMFISAAFIAIFIAWVTVAIHTFRAANANPIEALRDE